MSEALVTSLFGPPTKLPDETTTTFAVRLVQRDAAIRALATLEAAGLDENWRQAHEDAGGDGHTGEIAEERP